MCECQYLQDLVSIVYEIDSSLAENLSNSSNSLKPLPCPFLATWLLAENACPYSLPVALCSRMASTKI